MNELPANWGLAPVLFHLGGIAVPSYGVFVGAGIVAGLLVFLWLSRDERNVGEGTVYIAFAALFGGALGAKLLEAAFNAPSAVGAGWGALLAGRTVIGGLVGGSVGIVVVKRALKIRERRGNILAPAVALGLAVGRIGCLLRGCCHGEPTSLPWGIDFGDGVPRHPTQIYESIFALAMFFALLALRKRVVGPGRLFTIFASSYLAFRFFEEFVRAGARVLFGLTVYQYAALGGLLYFALKDRLLAPAARRGEA
ncbi:MAG: prolipoprotein diacylglyceryl transferase family protein [Candidatus Polarisedimenticolia bacterium]